MFTALQIVPPPQRGPLGRLLAHLRRPPVILERVEVPGDPPVFFDLITTERNKRGIDWQTVYRAAGENAQRLLLPLGTEPPDGSGIARFDPTRFFRVTLANGAISVLEQAAKRGARLSVALFDKNAACTALLPRLLACAEELRVVTLRPDDVDACAEALLIRMGAAPIVSTDPASTADCRVALAPYGTAGFGFLPCHPFLFAPDLSGSLQVEADSFRFPTLAEWVPPGIHPTEFAAALWQFGRRRELAASIPQYFVRLDKKFQQNQLIDAICGLDTGTANHYNETII